MTLAQEEFAHAEDSLLLRQIKEQQWDDVRVMVGMDEGKAPEIVGRPLQGLLLGEMWEGCVAIVCVGVDLERKDQCWRK